jgi:RNA ligase (TIGR02306 family)
MRKLASIKTISSIMPIEGKDRIVLAMVDGWSVIVKKDEFQVGDKCVYCEIDSVMPETEQFEFLRSKKFRIKTMRMSGVVSQGICFPMSILPDGSYEIEQDVTEILGIKQYEDTMDVEPEIFTHTKKY